MNNNLIQKLTERINKNKVKYQSEKGNTRNQKIIDLKIQIDSLRIELEKLRG
jgi:hypothetical protein